MPPTTTPLPSRAILIIGVLSVTCLLLLALLILQLTSGSQPVPELARTTQVAVSSEADPYAEPTMLTNGSGSALTEEQRRTLDLAAQEPAVGELAAVLTVIVQSYEAGDSAVPNALRPYLARLAGRLNAREDRYHARIYADDGALAERRAAELRHVFDTVGLIPEMLTLTGLQGRPSVDVERL